MCLSEKTAGTEVVLVGVFNVLDLVFTWGQLGYSPKKKVRT